MVSSLILCLLHAATPQINYGQFLTTFLLQILCCNLKIGPVSPATMNINRPGRHPRVIPMSTGNPYPYTLFGHQTTFEKPERSTASVALTIKPKFNSINVSSYSSNTKPTGHPGRPYKILGNQVDWLPRSAPSPPTPHIVSDQSNRLH